MLSLFTGIISTINSYYGYAKRSENHRLVSIQYNKLFNFINLELSLNRNERMNAKNMLKIIRLEIERLIEKHNLGYVKSTKNGVPYILKSKKLFLTEIEAIQEERRLKKARNRTQ
jgi:hypothetical protein